MRSGFEKQRDNPKKSEQKHVKEAYQEMPAEKQFILAMDVLKLHGLYGMFNGLADSIIAADDALQSSQEEGSEKKVERYRKELSHRQEEQRTIGELANQLKNDLHGRFGEDLVNELGKQLRDLQNQDDLKPRDQRTGLYDIGRPDTWFFREEQKASRDQSR